MVIRAWIEVRVVVDVDIQMQIQCRWERVLKANQSRSRMRR